jgi:hypothetical protein
MPSIMPPAYAFSAKINIFPGFQGFKFRTVVGHDHTKGDSFDHFNVIA